MTIFHAFILGTVQGITEFLPISSSGHLIIFPTILGWDVQSLAFDTTLHLGTALALIIYFYRDIINMFLNNRKFALNILVGSIPAGVAGFFLESTIENAYRGIFYVSIFLLAGSALMLYANKLSMMIQEREITMKTSLVVGFFQALALFPGISRSGATISGSLLMGISKENAAKFSFLLSIPIVVGAGAFKVYKSLNGLSETGVEVLAVGFFSSFIVGLFAINFMLNFLKKRGLEWFIVYRLILALVLLAFHFFFQFK